MEGGIDEAGRGPVIGPMVVAGIATADPQALWDMGCRDSKLLTPVKRERLARLLADDPDVQIVVEILTADELDLRMASATLNEIEVQVFRSIAAKLNAKRIVVDAADGDAARFGRRVGHGLAATIVSEHKADTHHATVAAASVVAKVTRDVAVESLGKRLERDLGLPIGSGYPSDPITVRFLEAWVKKHGDVPPGTRRAWKTTKRLLDQHKARSLDSF